MNQRRLPDWLKKNLSPGRQSDNTAGILDEEGIHTICAEGKCPNRNECYSRRTAAFLILGDRCTRHCLFCAVKSGAPSGPDPAEPARVACAVKRMRLRHAVITSVTRDDLDDGGAAHFAVVIMAVRSQNPGIIIEVLTPDFKNRTREAAALFSDLPIQIFNHNMETVRRLHPVLRPQGDYGASLELLKAVRGMNPGLKTKSGAMLGLGESRREVQGLLEDLRDHGCRILTLGQYLRPTPEAAEVARYACPEEFEYYRRLALSMGFKSAFCAPFVRSSYRAEDCA